MKFDQPCLSLHTLDCSNTLVLKSGSMWIFLVSGCKTKKSQLAFKAAGVEYCHESQTPEKEFKHF